MKTEQNNEFTQQQDSCYHRGCNLRMSRSTLQQPKAKEGESNGIMREEGVYILHSALHGASFYAKKY